jgi:hypothetical protein
MRLVTEGLLDYDLDTERTTKVKPSKQSGAVPLSPYFVEQ